MSDIEMRIRGWHRDNADSSARIQAMKKHLQAQSAARTLKAMRDFPVTISKSDVPLWREDETLTRVKRLLEQLRVGCPIDEWCRDQFGEGNYVISTHIVGFSNKNDAFAFKLRWM